MNHLARVRALPCCICEAWGLPQLSPTQAHHAMDGRFSTVRVPDAESIPLCEGHHIGLMDTSKIAYHRQPALWREEYGSDREWIAPTLDRLERKELT